MKVSSAKRREESQIIELIFAPLRVFLWMIVFSAA